MKFNISPELVQIGGVFVLVLKEMNRQKKNHNSMLSEFM